jgi:flagellar basal-body rod modification protein FlgD
MAAIDENLQTTLSNLGLYETEKKASGSTELGQNEFLKLMITQLNTQDPFNPQDNGEFIAQMAQFSSVTGLAELQQSFDKLATSLQSNQALQASSLVGRSVLTPTSIATLPQSGALTGAIDLPASSSSLALVIQDDSGQVLRRLELGAQKAGDVYFSWDGMTDAGVRADSGQYYISAEAQAGGETYAVPTLVDASVESVTLGKGGQGLTLNLSDGSSVGFDSVREIK